MATRIDGMLVRWNEARGFGFITPADGSADVFVHVSAFPRGAGRPGIGERVSFELAAGPGGKARAVRIGRPGMPNVDAQAPLPRSAAPRRRSGARPLSRLALAVIAAAAVYLWSGREVPDRQPVVIDQASASRLPAFTRPRMFTCDGRTHCSEMTSCVEASWFIRNCPGTKMDGDGDGIPCERQWCE